MGTGTSDVAQSGPVTVTTVSSSANSSNDHFSYMQPEIHKFMPNLGPRSGGTLITVFGKDLKIGTNYATPNATIAGNPCDIIRTENSWLVCRTQATSAPVNGSLRM